MSDIAGTTRDAVDTLVRMGDETNRFVDTAGIRRKGKTNDTLGLALSGGGYRSAIFNYGVLRGLASIGILPSILSAAAEGGRVIILVSDHGHVPVSARSAEVSRAAAGLEFDAS